MHHRFCQRSWHLAALLATTALVITASAADAAKPDTAHPGTYDVVTHMVRDTGSLIDTRTGFAHALYRLNIDVAPDTPERMARQALAGHAADLGLDEMPGMLTFNEVVESPGALHVRFRQTIDSVPVYRGDVVVSISKATSRVGMILSNVHFDAPRAVPSPGVGSDAAIRIGRDHLGLRGNVIGEERVELTILDGRLVWRVNLPNTDPLGDWIVNVDAMIGVIVGAYDQAVFVDGSGLTFDPDPLTSAEAEYGEGGFVDNDDADSEDLNNERFPVTLPDITFSDGMYYLEGPHCKLLDFEGPFDGTTSEADPDDFIYTRFEQGFEDVLVYHHIDKNQRYIQSLGFFNIQNTPIECDPHGLNGADNSHYLSGPNRIAWGEGCVDDAEDVDVVLHEYGHAIQHGSVPGWGGGEEGAMGEGFGDYWCGSYSRDFSEFHWNWVFNWDGHNECWGGRWLDRTWTYPDDMIGQVHHDGQIWSAALMKIWEEIGRTPIDLLTLASHFYLGTSATMIDGAEAVIQADIDNFDSLNMDTLVEWFVHRGFLDDNDWPLPSIGHFPLENQGSTGPFTIVAFISSNEPVSDAQLVYGIDGQQMGSVAMTHVGEEQYEGTLPDQGAGLVQYYIVASTSTEFVATSPRPAPTEWHRFEAGTVEVRSIGGAGVTRLIGAAPNPFNPITTLSFSIATSEHVAMRVYDASGRHVRSLIDRSLTTGTYQIRWDGHDDFERPLASGVYVIRMDAGGVTETKRVILLR